MLTRATKDPDAVCLFARVDDSDHEYLCLRPSRIVWVATPDADVPVCRQCHAWLQIMESLGLKLT